MLVCTALVQWMSEIRKTGRTEVKRRRRRKRKASDSTGECMWKKWKALMPARKVKERI